MPRDPNDVLLVPELSVAKFSVNLNKALACRTQVVVMAGSGVDSHYLGIRASRDDGRSWKWLDLADGPKAPLAVARIRDGEALPVVGEWTSVAPEFQRDNVIVHPVLFTDDPAGEVIVGNIYFETRSVAATVPPPSTPYPGPEAPPSGGALGNLLLDLNAMEITGLADGDTVSTWEDLSGIGNDAVVFSGVAAPTYEANGLGSGLPSVRFNGSTQALRFPIPSQQAFTVYYVVGNLAGSSPSSDRYPNGSQILSNQGGGSGESFGIALMADGKISYGVGENFFVNTAASRKTASAWAGEPINVHAFVRQPVGGHYFYWVDGSNESGGGDNATGSDLNEVPHVYIAIKPGVGYPGAFDMGRGLWYDAAHGSTEIATVTAYLRTLWGTP